MVDLNYMTTKTAAERWNITQRRVLALCAEDRIEGFLKMPKNPLTQEPFAIQRSATICQLNLSLNGPVAKARF